MNWLTDLLSSNTWSGIQGILAVLAILVNVFNPREIIFKRKPLNGIRKIPWLALFVVGGIIASLSFSVELRDISRAVNNLFVTLIIALSIQVLILYRSREFVQKEAIATKNKFNDFRFANRRLAHLHIANVSIKLVERQLFHTIDENGNGILREEIEICVDEGVCYFYPFRYSYELDSTSTPLIEISAINIEDDCSLHILELESTDSILTGVVILDPPATTQKNIRICISCRRQKIWKSLVEKGDDDASFLVQLPTDKVQVTLLAPAKRKWKAFRPSPEIGIFHISTNRDSLSCVTWNLIGPTLRRYRYKIHLD